MMHRLKGFVLSLFTQTNERNCWETKVWEGGGRKGTWRGRITEGEGEKRGRRWGGRGFLRMDTGKRPCLVGSRYKSTKHHPDGPLGSLVSLPSTNLFN